MRVYGPLWKLLIYRWQTLHVEVFKLCYKFVLRVEICKLLCARRGFSESLMSMFILLFNFTFLACLWFTFNKAKSLADTDRFVVIFLFIQLRYVIFIYNFCGNMFYISS